MPNGPVPADAAGLPDAFAIFDQVVVGPIDQPVDAQLEELNVEFDRAHRVLRACSLAADGADPNHPLTKSFELAQDHAARVMSEARVRANMLMPASLRGFALKVRLFTDCEPDQWLASREAYLITNLLGQILSAAALSPISKCKDDTASKIFSAAAGGRPFRFFAIEQSHG